MNIKLKDLKLKEWKPRTEKEFEEELAFQISMNVFDIRMRKGMTQEELAKEIGTKQPSIARLEAGSLLPSVKFLEKIARALEVKMVDFFKDKPASQDIKPTITVSWPIFSSDSLLVKESKKETFPFISESLNV